MCHKNKAFVPMVIVLLIAALQIGGSAAAKMRLTCEDVQVQAGQTFFVTVNAADNPGLMGFKITVAYDDAVLRDPQVLADGITKNGSLNDSIGVAPGTAFDVLWTNTASVPGDGALLTLGFTVAPGAADTVIKVVLSAPDTFTEKWETVQADPLEIRVTVEKDADVGEPPAEAVTGEEHASPTEAGTENQTEPAQPTDPPGVSGDPVLSFPSEKDRDLAQFLISVVSKALEETQKERILDVEKKEQADFTELVNDIADELSDEPVPEYASFDSLSNAYTDAVKTSFAENALRNSEPQTIQKAIGTALEQVGADAVETVAPEKRAEFVKAFENEMAQASPSLPAISDRISVDDTVGLIAAIRNVIAAPPEPAAEDPTQPAATEPEVSATVPGEIAAPAPEKTERFPTWAIVVCAAVGMLAIAVTVLVFVKKKK